MPLENDLDKILIIGSGPTLVGSVAEMDLLANDAIDAFLEEGISVVLVNPNPATISSDTKKGVTVYLEPMTLDFLKRILRMEEPDAIITAYGSTTGLKVARKLIHDGILNQMNIKLLTLNPQTLTLNVQRARSEFLKKLSIKQNQSWQLSVLNPHDLASHFEQIKETVSFPVFVTRYHRYVHNEHLAFKDLASLEHYFELESKNDNFSWNNYRLSEDLSSWEEVVINVIRDHDGNLLFTNIAGSIESVGVNSGDSALVMPALTLNNDQVQELKHTCKQIADHLNLLGIMSIHFAVRHHGTQIESKVLSLTPRITRSAVWIQRIGLYSVGYIVAKIAIGYNLNEIIDPLSGLNASIEPTLDAVAIKMPFWSLTESGNNHYYLNSKMQASGEAIGIASNFESAFFKGLASTVDFDIAWEAFIKESQKSNEDILQDLSHPDELHLIRILAAISKGMTYTDLLPIVNLHPVYFQKLQNITRIAKELHENSQNLPEELLLEAKRRGFANKLIAKLTSKSNKQVVKLLSKAQIKPAYLQIDGSADVFKPKVENFYSAYDVEDEAVSLDANKKVLIIGMLPLQVSVTSEFDYMLSHAVESLHNNGYATIMISNNDESVASSYKKVDRVYFEPITIENILDIAQKEGIKEVLLQFSGKKISTLKQKLLANGLKIIGQDKLGLTQKIKELLKNPLFGLLHVPSLITKSSEQVYEFAAKYGFPILIGGSKQKTKQKSAVVYDIPAMKKYLTENRLEKINVSRFIEGDKYEVTAISDGKNTTIPGIIEHLEQTGSHASDSIAVFKPQNLNQAGMDLLSTKSIKLINHLNTRGIFNLHYLRVGDKWYLLQIKPYAGHNVAFLSKALGQDITAYATEVLIGKELKELTCPSGLWPANDLIHVKMPVFSFINYQSENTFDSKMKSSGSVMGRDTQLDKALYKGYEASDLHIPSFGTIFISVRDQDKEKVANLAKRFSRLGFKLLATEGTANIIAEAGITTGVVEKLQDNKQNLLDKIKQHKIVMVVNITNLSDTASEDAIMIRDQALYTHIPVFSSIETAELILNVLESLALTTQPI